MRFICISVLVFTTISSSVFALDGLALQTEEDGKEFRGGKLFVHNMANGERKEIFSGHACGPSFSPDGKRVSFLDVKNKKVTVCDLDGRNIKELCSVNYNDLGVTYWLADGYIYYNYHNNEIFRVKDEGGSQETVYKSSNMIQQFGISQNGKRIAWTQPGYSVVVTELGVGGERNFGSGCQGTTSPDGKYVTHNIGGHTEVAIHNWDDKSVWKKLKTPIGKFNLHRWAHHSQDYIVYSIEGKATGYVHNVETNQAKQAGKGTIWDFWNGAVSPVSQPLYKGAQKMIVQDIIISQVAENGVLSIFAPTNDRVVSEVFLLDGTRLYSKTTNVKGWFTMSIPAANHNFLLARVRNAQGVAVQQIVTK